MKWKNDKQRKAAMAAIMRRKGLTKGQKARLVSPRTMVNPARKRDLELYTVNTREIYDDYRLPTEKWLEKRWKKGDYDKDKAQLQFLKDVEAGAKKYAKELDEGRMRFSKADKIAVAKSLERSFRDQMEIENPTVYTVRLKR